MDCMGQTVRVPLSNGGFALVDAAGVELVSRYRWHVFISPRCNTPYAVASLATGHRGSKSTSMHRLLMNAQPGQRVDHRNLNGLDNRRENLRFATNAQDIANMRIRGGSSQYKGVYYDKWAGRWKAQIGHNGRRLAIGGFATEEAAARAYNARASELFGEFARLNVIAPAALAGH